jgi:zinc D-Ala-D-Ala carboxypeptidase
MIDTINFKAEEFNCNCCGDNQMVDSFVEKLQLIRSEFQKPIKINSGYRCPAHNERVSGTKSRTGPHTTGRAADLSCRGGDMYLLLRLALKYGMTGIGIKGSGSSRFLHIDDLQAEDGDRYRPTVWTY